MQNDLAHPPAPSAGAADDAESLSWWASRSSDDLKVILQRGLSGGDLFDGANREMRRRLDALDRADEQAHVVEVVNRRYQLGWIALAALGTLGLLIGIIV